MSKPEVTIGIKSTPVEIIQDELRNKRAYVIRCLEESSRNHGNTRAALEEYISLFEANDVLLGYATLKDSTRSEAAEKEG